MNVRPTAASVLLFLAALLPAGAGAQAIAGTIVDNGTGKPIEGVHVTLLDEQRQAYADAYSDADGWFDLAVPRSGRWILAADLIGYGSIVSDPVDVGAGERVAVEIRMDVEAVALEPLVVTSRTEHLNPEIQAFYDRLERGRRSGLGQYVSREDVERRAPTEATDLFQGMAGVRITRRVAGSGRGLRMSGNCIPAIYVDGSQLNRWDESVSLDDYVAAYSIEGIEVYRGTGQQVGHYHDSTGCGLILVWTQRGSSEGGPFSWKRFLIGSALLAALFLFR